MIPRRALLADRLRAVQVQLRAHVAAAMQSQHPEMLASVVHESSDDTIYHVDRIGEELLLDLVGREIAPEWPLVLIAEGLPGGWCTLPDGLEVDRAVIRLIFDPIDGTRGLMYQKRSGWILAGAAPNRGTATSLADIEVAVQTEIGPVKQAAYDVLWAIAGEGAAGVRVWPGAEAEPLALRPSAATTLEHGFATICRFFPGVRAELAALDDDVMRAVLGPPRPGRAQCFEDQYICSGGQIYELAIGHDRFTADLRALLVPLVNAQGRPAPICSHPYDLCTALIAREAGVVITGGQGGPLDAPLDVSSDVSWVGYANSHIQRLVEPALQAILARYGVG